MVGRCLPAFSEYGLSNWFAGNRDRRFGSGIAFNVAPNRTLQKAGFKNVKTHMTVPDPLIFYQAGNRWMLKR